MVDNRTQEPCRQPPIVGAVSCLWLSISIINLTESRNTQESTLWACLMRDFLDSVHGGDKIHPKWEHHLEAYCLFFLSSLQPCLLDRT